MASNLRLRYVLDLVSNIGARANADAQVMQKAQAQMQAAITGTSSKFDNWNKVVHLGGQSAGVLAGAITGAVSKFDALDRVVARVGSNTSLERQIGYVQRLREGITATQLRAEKMADALRKGLPAAQGAIVGAGAAGFVAKAALDKPMDYDTRLRYATSTAYAGQDLAGLRKGLAELEAMINGTVRATPGASREGTLGAYEKLVGTGAFTDKESRQLLPSIMRTSVASGASADDLVQAAEKMKVNFGLTPEQVALGLSKIMRAGQEGGFEIKDSAKWIGPLAPMMTGYKGMAGVEAMVTMLQQVRSTAGSNDDAANNMRNFLQKVPAESTAKDFKKQGIDIHAEMAKGAVRGEAPIVTYMAQLDKVMARLDPDAKARQAMMAADPGMSPEEKAKRIEDVKNIYKKAGLGAIMADMQELAGYAGLAGTQAYGAKVAAAVKAEDGNAVNTGYQFLAEGLGAKSTALAARKDMAMTDAMHGIEGPLGKLLDGTSLVADAFPGLASSAALASVALGALAASNVLQGLLIARGAGAVAGATAAKAAAGTAAAAGGGMMAAAVPLATVGAGLFAGYQSFKLLDAVGQLVGVKQREGVTLTPQAQARLQKPGTPFPLQVPQMDFLSLTAPGAASQNLGAGKTTEIKVGDGRMVIDVRVSDDRAPSAFFTVQQQPSLLKINPGATNPGSLPR